MYKSYMKNALYLAASAELILSLSKYCFLPLFANVIKNNKTRLVIYIIVCLPKTK